MSMCFVFLAGSISQSIKIWNTRNFRKEKYKKTE